MDDWDDEPDEFDLNIRFTSECCGAYILGEVTGTIGLCSRCKEWSGVVEEPEE